MTPAFPIGVIQFEDRLDVFHSLIVFIFGAEAGGNGMKSIDGELIVLEGTLVRHEGSLAVAHALVQAAWKKEGQREG